MHPSPCRAGDSSCSMIHAGESRDLKPQFTAASASAPQAVELRLAPSQFSFGGGEAGSRGRFVRIIVSGTAGGKFSGINFALFLRKLEMVERREC